MATSTSTAPAVIARPAAAARAGAAAAVASSTAKALRRPAQRSPTSDPATAGTARAAGRLAPFDASAQRLARRADEVSQPERLWHPAAAALFEEALGLGAGDVARHEDQPPRPRAASSARPRGRTPCRPPSASSDRRSRRRRRARATLRERFFAVGGPIDQEALIAERCGDRLAQRLFVLDDERTGALRHLRQRLRRGRARAAAMCVPPTGNSRRNEAPRPPGDDTLIRPPCSCAIA